MTDLTPRLRIDDFDYDLPPDRIAQEPLADRAASRLLLLDRTSGAMADRHFRDIVTQLHPGDLLVVNDTRVIPARLKGHRETGGQVELLLLRTDGNGVWRSLARPAKRIRIGEAIIIPANAPGLPNGTARLVEKLDDGQVTVQLEGALGDHVDAFGEMPLPPYITRRLDDAERYQTVYAEQRGSAAAPTAGLHFTPELLATLDARGVRIAHVTLHVGLDTFRPVSEEYADEHEIHSEWCAVPPETYRAIMDARAAGQRVIAVGTTSARTLETLGQRERSGQPGPFGDFTRLYITPGYEWTLVDAMITNFHLPKSTLLLMISAFAGRDLVLRAYRHAIAAGYRFFSFGDAMFIS